MSTRPAISEPLAEPGYHRQLLINSGHDGLSATQWLQPLDRPGTQAALPQKATKQFNAEAPVVISHYDELSAFAASRAFWSKQPLVLRIPSMSAPEAFETGERLNRDRHQCGCGTGALALFAGLLFAVAGLVAHYGLWKPLFLHLPLALVAAFLSAALGKVAGIAMGRRRARRRVAQLLADSLW